MMNFGQKKIQYSQLFKVINTWAVWNGSMTDKLNPLYI